MTYLWENGSCNVSDLGNTILLDSSTLTPLLKKLESKGFINWNRSSINERNLIISLTKKGEDLKVRDINIPDRIGMCINLSKEEIENLYKIMYKILINIEKENL